ncbi:MAG: disulfide bond formation protein B [Roseiarcus sp.]
MNANEDSESPLSVVLDRLILWLMLLVLAGILTAAMVIQFADREIPCPLCLLERVAMFGCCFGLIQQLRSDGSQRGAGIGLVFSVLLLVISARQTLLDLFPRPGHAYVGGAVFGVHMPVWSVFIAVALLLGFALRLAIFGGPRAAPETEGSTLRRLTYGLSLYVIVICGINCLAVLVRVGRMSHVRLRASALDRRFKRAPGGPETLPGRAACKGLPLRPAEIRCSPAPARRALAGRRRLSRERTLQRWLCFRAGEGRNGQPATSTNKPRRRNKW